MSASEVKITLSDENNRAKIILIFSCDFHRRQYTNKTTNSDFERTIEENVGVLHKLCRIYTFNQDEYEELFREMLVQIWRSHENFRGAAKISTFIYRICINTALGFRSKIARYKNRFELLDGKIFTAPAPDDDKNERLQKLYRAIRGLKPIDRAIVSLYPDDKSYEETAEILSISKTNVATRLSRLKKQLTEKLAV